jgi:hypothetical protein
LGLHGYAWNICSSGGDKTWQCTSQCAERAQAKVTWTWKALPGIDLLILAQYGRVCLFTGGQHAVDFKEHAQETSRKHKKTMLPEVGTHNESTT